MRKLSNKTLYLRSCLLRAYPRARGSVRPAVSKIKTKRFFGFSVKKLISLFTNENINLSISSFYQELRNEFIKDSIY